MPHDHRRLLAGILHIRYTIDQLVAVLLWHIREGESPWVAHDNDVFRNACLESSLINLRILDEFFSPTGNKNRIKARFYDGYRLPSNTHILDKSERQKINDYLAHLTWARVDGGSAACAHESIYRCLPIVVHFLSYLLVRFLQPQDDEYTNVKELRDSLRRLIGSSPTYRL